MTQSTRCTATKIATLLGRGASAASIASLLFASSCASTPMFAGRKARREAALAAKRPDAQPITDVATGKALPSYADRLEAAKQSQKPVVATSESGVEHAVVGERHLAAKIERLSHEEPAADEGKAKVASSTDRPWAPDLNGFPAVPILNDAAIAAQFCPPTSSVPSYCPPCGTNAAPAMPAVVCANLTRALGRCSLT